MSASLKRRSLAPALGFDWPGPDVKPCGKVAIERGTGERFQCLLHPLHESPCHWQEIVGDELRSVDWMATGEETYVGR